MCQGCIELTLCYKVIFSHLQMQDEVTKTIGGLNSMGAKLEPASSLGVFVWRRANPPRRASPLWRDPTTLVTPLIKTFCVYMDRRLGRRPDILTSIKTSFCYGLKQLKNNALMPKCLAPGANPPCCVYLKDFQPSQARSYFYKRGDQSSGISPKTAS